MKRSIAVVPVLTALILAACGNGSTSDTLVVYSGRSEDLVAPLIERFEAETDIEVEVRYADSTELAATLLAEGSATDADVFFAQDPASLGSVAELLAPLPADVLARVPERFADAGDRWVGTSGRVRVLVFDTEAVDRSELPSTVDELIRPEWSTRVGVAPINGSFLAFVAAMILERGESETLAWLEGLAANDPIDYPGNSPIVAAADAGEVSAGLVNHYYLLRLRAEGAGARAENHFFAPGDVGGLVMPAGAGVLDDSDQADAALEFVTFLLSTSSQEYFATETFEYPLVQGVPASPDLPPIEAVEGPDIDLSELADALERATDLVTEAGLL